MKILKILSILALPLMMLLSCDKSELEVNVKEGGLLEIKTPSLNYVVGNSGPYTGVFRVYQGETKVTQIDIYATFNSTRPDTLVETDLDGKIEKSVIYTKLKSNTVKFTTINLTSDVNSIEEFSFNFADIQSPFTIETEEQPAIETDKEYVVIKGFSRNDVGQGLPASDGDYTIGDYWEFRYDVTTSDGRVVTQDKPTKTTVATRYAGKYKCLKGEYWHPSLGNYYHTGDWPDETIIESVDAKTYRVLEYIGPFDGNEWYFQIEDGIISYPLEWNGEAQILNDQPLITCQTNPSDLTNVCGEAGANTVVNDDVNGKDQLIMALGYYTSGSGPRQFYQKFEKIVE